MAKRYNYKDNFEMLYLRHEYITKNKNINGKYVKEYEKIVKTTARLMYYKLYPNFNKVGFDQEDLIAITNVYLLGYMNNYSLLHSKKELVNFTKKFYNRKGINPTQEEIVKSERNRLINFLRQKIQHCSTVCARKARNITVGRDRRRTFAETSSSKSAAEEDILNDYKKYGYRLVTSKEYKGAIQQAKKLGEKDLIDKNGYRIFQIQILNNGISKEDYALLFNDNSMGQFYRSPEESLIFKQESRQLELNRQRFNKLTVSAKKRSLVKFIEQNRGNIHLKVELKAARKILKSIKENGIISDEDRI